MKLTTIKDFGGWDAVQKKHFADGGVFDEIYETRAGGVISSHCGPGTLGVLFIAGE